MALSRRGVLALVGVLLALGVVIALIYTLPYKVYVVHTGSMSPTIPSRSAVVVNAGHYRVGQVATFTHNGELITHRLVARNADGTLSTKGDGNSSNDPWTIAPASVIGGVVTAPRMVGWWIVYFKNPLGVATVLLLIATLWQIWSLAEMAGEPASA
ncbi:MAG: signal peptidase I [Cellulomonas sp.]